METCEVPVCPECGDNTDVWIVGPGLAKCPECGEYFDYDEEDDD